MDGVSGSGPGHQTQAPFDKSRVLDVKPLRTLVPSFPNPPQAPPFSCSSPFGPFPSGFTPFYPFTMAPPAEPEPGQGGGPTSFASPAAAVPLRSYRTPNFSNGDTESSMGASGGKKRGRKKKIHKEEAKVAKAVSGENRKPNLANVVGLPQLQREDGDRDVVNYVMIKFDGVRRRLSQLEDSQRADLKAGNILLTAGFRTNSRKRIGAVPGVEIGDVYFFRMELCVLGLHAPSMAGIDYMSVKTDMEEEPLAVSIVSSGGYDDDAEDADVLVYTGQGGGNYGNTKGASDQKLERGNLALEKSARRGNQIRVIRGIRDVINPNLKIYFYDGLYTIQDSWIEKSKTGASTFKYRLVRLPGQGPAFGTWQSVLKWKESVSSRPGLILPDLTSGAESLPVALVNDFDDEKGPPYFTYLRTVRYTKSLNLSDPSYGCHCRNACAAGDPNCACIRKNGGDLPYAAANGVLVSRKPLVYECGPSCPCVPNCKNRVSQSGLKVRLEVFKTRDRGWGLRTWDAIRAGTYICEFAGEVIEKAKYDKDESSDSGDYVFDTSRAYDKSFKWNYDPQLVGEDATTDVSEEYDIPTPLIINAKDSGNVARFMNHSCAPTVFWQPVVYEQDGEAVLHIAFFAIRHIPPMTELTYDYGLSQSESRRKQCLCGAPRCKGYFG